MAILCEHYPSYIKDPQESFTYLQTLPYVQNPEVVLYGKVQRQRRNVVMYSKEGVLGYRYSGNIMPARPISEQVKLVELLDTVNGFLKTDLNGLLINQYKDGNDYIGAHSDSESSIDTTQPIVSLSFGESRIFRIRDKKSKQIVQDFVLKSGDLFVMKSGFQSLYTHEIPKQTKVGGERISVTFRKHLS